MVDNEGRSVAHYCVLHPNIVLLQKVFDLLPLNTTIAPPGRVSAQRLIPSGTEWLQWPDKKGQTARALARAAGHTTLLALMNSPPLATVGGDWRTRARHWLRIDPPSALLVSPSAVNDRPSVLQRVLQCWKHWGIGTLVTVWVAVWISLWQYHQYTVLRPVSLYSDTFHFIIRYALSCCCLCFVFL